MVEACAVGDRRNAKRDRRSDRAGFFKLRRMLFYPVCSRRLQSRRTKVFVRHAESAPTRTDHPFTDRVTQATLTFWTGTLEKPSEIGKLPVLSKLLAEGDRIVNGNFFLVNGDHFFLTQISE